MTTAELFEFEDALSGVSSDADVKMVYDRYKHLNHPIFYNRFAHVYFHNYESYDLARPFIIKCISFGLNHNNEFANTPFIDMITQDILLLLQNEPNLDTDLQFKLACLNFVYLSSLIIKHDTAAYNSYEQRALLIKLSNKRQGIAKMLKTYYYDGPDLCVEILTFGDFSKSSIGYSDSSETENANKTEREAILALNHLKSLPQYSKMDMLNKSQIVSLSLQNTKHLYDKLIPDFNRGVFDIKNFNI